MTNHELETGPMTTADCPLCDAPAAIDLEDAGLDCPACGHFEIADEDGHRLAAAA